MNYVSFGLEVLSQPQFLGSPEELLGTWVKLIRFCASAENGGRIEEARAWNERLWLITCGLPLTLLKKDSEFWKWEGSTLVVLHYPVWSEDKCKRSRAGALKTNTKRWGGKRVAERHGKRVAVRVRIDHNDHNDHNVLKGDKNNAASPPNTDLKTRWAATKAEIQRLEALEAERDGELSAEDSKELTRLRKQLNEITRQQAEVPGQALKHAHL